MPGLPSTTRIYVSSAQSCDGGLLLCSHTQPINCSDFLLRSNKAVVVPCFLAASLCHPRVALYSRRLYRQMSIGSTDLDGGHERTVFIFLLFVMEDHEYHWHENSRSHQAHVMFKVAAASWWWCHSGAHRQAGAVVKQTACQTGHLHVCWCLVGRHLQSDG